MVKRWPKPQSIYNIQVFLGFANLCRWFIKGFRRIAAPLTLILKITAPLASEKWISFRSNKKKRNIDDVNRVSSDKINYREINLSRSNNIKTIRFGAGFLTFKAKLAFTQLKRYLLKLWSYNILTQSVICELTLMLQDMLLVKY